MPRRDAKPRFLGLIGLGLMGTALAERALRGGFQVVGFDLDPSRRRALRHLGGRPLASANDVAVACPRLLLSLPTTDIVETVVRQMEGALVPGHVLIDTTTGDPERTARLGAGLAQRGVSYLDATIVGSSAETRQGQVLLLVGAKAAALERCRDVLECLARRVVLVGPWGSGARMKLVINLVLGLNRAALAEGLSFARACGVSPELALDIMRDSVAYSRVMDFKGPKMLQGDFKPVARLSQHLKDVRLILAAGRRGGAKLPLSRVHCKLLEAAMAAGWGELDNSAIIKVYTLLRSRLAAGAA
jgi:3-hydroxyisobutyrate dehydrogenase-like beta-hydroxyacid dehydrogenase